MGNQCGCADQERKDDEVTIGFKDFASPSSVYYDRKYQNLEEGYQE